MPIVHKSRVKETASNKPNASTAFNLPSSAATGFRTFAAALSNADQCPYHATNGTDWESGIGTFATGSPATLARTVILESSTGGSAINWSAGGNVDVWIEWPAEYANRVQNNGYLSVTTDGTTSQTLSGSTASKISAAFATESSDPNGWWDHSNKRFQPTRPGLYFVQAWVQLKSVSAGAYQLFLYKNGTKDTAGQTNPAPGSSWPACTVETEVFLNGTTDYIEAYMWCDSSAPTNQEIGSCGFKASWRGF